MCFLKIDVMDVNNKSPRFTTGNLDTVGVNENVQVGTMVTRLKAEAMKIIKMTQKKCEDSWHIYICGSNKKIAYLKKNYLQF